MGAGVDTDKVGLTQLQKSRMASKLARQMAYKKRLEEEYREFQERCKVRQAGFNNQFFIISDIISMKESLHTKGNWVSTGIGVTVETRRSEEEISLGKFEIGCK